MDSMDNLVSRLPIGDFRATARYRATVAANLVRRLHLQTTAPETVAEVFAL